MRDRLGITPGTEVEIHEEAGKAIVEPEDDPEQIIERMEQLVEETAPNRSETAPIDDVDPIAKKHRETVRNSVRNDSDE